MKRVLVVDDERDIAEALSAVLETEGYTPSTRGDGFACLEAVREQRPDLILLDIMMPRLDGFGVLEQLEAEALDVPVVMMSAVRPAQRLAQYESRLAGFMKKPFELDVLLDKIEAVIGRP